MKKLLFLLLTVIMTLTVNAERVSKQEALLKAQQFMPNKQFGGAKAFARGEKTDSPAEFEAFYIFNAGNKGGFVIVSGDDRTEPILGYSDRGSLNPDSVPDNVKGLLNYYEKVLTTIANDKNYTRPVRTRGAEERKTVKTLMATEWGQDFPYNLNCPIFEGKRTVTGCVATAMAQVLYYNRWPKDYTSAVPAYTTWSKQIEMPQLEPTKFNWGFFGAKDYGRLLLYCGQAVQMNYGITESGADTSIIPELLKNIFGYNDGAQCVIRENYTDEEWDNMMYAEMAGGRPVIYSGFGWGATYSGHAFVIDGYDSGRYHVNWGWDGTSNGLFLLTGLDAAGGSYNDYQAAVIGIQSPEGITEVVKPKVQVGNVIHGSRKNYWRQSDGSFPAFNITAIVNSTSSEKETVQLGWGLFNEDGLIKVFAQEQQEISPYVISPENTVESYGHEASIIIDNSIEDGDYSLLPISKSNDLEEWVADSLYEKNPGCFTEIHIANNLLTLLYADNYWNTTKGLDRINHGYAVENGVSYNLWEELGKKYATVIPPQSGKYTGSINILDMVSHHSMEYIVYDADVSAFEHCQELTSISTSMHEGPRIVDCPQLANIELREGVSALYHEISQCPELTTIEFPASLSDFYCYNPITNCENLKTITVKSPGQIGNTSLWDCLPALTDVYLMSSFPRKSDWVLNADDNVTIHIPKGSLSLYKKSIWKEFNLLEENISSNLIRWGYDLDTEVEKFYFQVVGHPADPDIDFAIHVPAEMLQNYNNQEITGIEFYTDGTYSPDYVFITKPGTDYLRKQPTNLAPAAGWKHIYFSEPFEITGEELFIGIGRKGECGSPYSPKDLDEEDGSWIRVMVDNKQWEHIKDNTHPWPIRFFIEGEDFPKDVRLCQSKMEYEESFLKLRTNVVNRCPEALTSYTIKWDVDGKVNGTKAIETSMASNMSEVLNLEIPSDLIGYYHTLTVDVTSVNGEEDGVPANSHLVYDFTSSETCYPRTIVLENYVGIWCPYTPRAYAMVEKLYNKYPNNFLSIDVHRYSDPELQDDPIGEPYNYSDNIERYTASPTTICNRTKYTNTLDIVYPVMEEQKDFGAAKVFANAVFASTDKTSVKVKTSSTFGFSDNIDFRIAYVVVEDNVGPYKQSNAYTDPTYWDNYDGFMDEWFKKGSPVEMFFNDVARGIYPGLNGLEGSVPASVEKGKAYEYEYTFDLPDNIQDKKNISIVTLLIDNKSGEIINADKTAVIEGELPDIFVEDAVVYEKLDEGKVAITDNGNSGDKCEIPETVTHDGVEYQVTAIAEKAFENKTNMKEVTIPQSVTVIGESAFAGCSNLVAIYCYAENPANLTGTVKARSRSGEEVSVASKVFEGVNKETCVLWVPKGCVAAYRNASGWGEFTNIKEMFKPGDANGDGELNETDRNYIIRHVMGDTPDDFDEEAANLNGDDRIDVADIVLLNKLLGENPSSLP